MQLNSGTVFVTPNKPLPKGTQYCVNCKHLRPVIRGMHEKYECKLFHLVDLVDGKKTYMLAESARHQKDLCGPQGAYFEPQDFSKSNVNRIDI